MNKLRTFIAFTGRLSVLILVAFLIECLLTFGTVTQFEEYTAIGWIVQLLIFVALVWAATEWHYAEITNNQ